MPWRLFSESPKSLLPALFISNPATFSLSIGSTYTFLYHLGFHYTVRGAASLPVCQHLCTAFQLPSRLTGSLLCPKASVYPGDNGGRGAWPCARERPGKARTRERWKKVQRTLPCARGERAERTVEGAGWSWKRLASVETVLVLRWGGWKKAQDQLHSLVNRDNSRKASGLSSGRESSGSLEGENAHGNLDPPGQLWEFQQGWENVN